MFHENLPVAMLGLVMLTVTCQAGWEATFLRWFVALGAIDDALDLLTCTRKGCMGLLLHVYITLVYLRFLLNEK